MQTMDYDALEVKVVGEEVDDDGEVATFLVRG